MFTLFAVSFLILSLTAGACFYKKFLPPIPPILGYVVGIPILFILAYYTEVEWIKSIIKIP